MPAHWTVLVLAARGWSAPWLSRQRVAPGWHPCLRSKLGATACVSGSSSWEWLSTWLPPLGEHWAARVSCFAEQKNRLGCTLVLCREAGSADAWGIVTALAPSRVHAACSS